MAEASTAGHLFITRGDVLRLACDAVLVPSGTDGGRHGHITEHWREALGARCVGGFVDPAPTADDPAVRVRPGKGIKRPAIWAGFTGDRGDEDAKFLGRAVRQFVLRAAEDARDRRKPDDARPYPDDRPLLALPLVGTGAGGQGSDSGGVLIELVEVLTTAAEEARADVALVLDHEEDYAAAQQARAAMDTGRSFRDLDDDLEKAAEDLAAKARKQQLVIFLGAGASIGAGLPSWSELLLRLGDAAGLNDAEKEQLGRLEPRDAGLILKARLAERGGLPKAVKRLVKAERGSIVHQLLASLPVDEAVTTNYDGLFERAWVDAGRRPAVLPRDQMDDDQPWLLQLHGSVDRPNKIVLSRDDYLRFEGEGVALAGIVQAMLLTRHMLFVGYSLSDDNFHRLVHQVRMAIGPGKGGKWSAKPFGTAITPRRPSLGDDLWRDQVRFVSTAGAREDDPRRAAVLLDRVGALAAAPAAHLLSTDYDALLDDTQRKLRKRLGAVWKLVDSGELDEPTRRVVVDALEQIGRPGTLESRRTPLDGE